MSLVSDLPASAKLLSKDASPTLSESMGQQSGYSGRMSWYVPWADLYTFMDVVAGSTEYVSVGVFVQYIPLRFPVPNQIILAESAEAQYIGWDKTGTNPITGEATGWYYGAKVTVSFATPQRPVSGTDAMLTVSRSPAPAPITYPAGTVSVGSGVNPEPITRNVQGWTITYGLQNVGGYSDTTFAPYAGYLNANTWRGYPAKTLMFNGVSSTQSSRFDGANTVDLQLPLQYREVPWDQEPDSSGGLSSHSLYGTIDYATLFGF